MFDFRYHLASLFLLLLVRLLRRLLQDLLDHEVPLLFARLLVRLRTLRSLLAQLWTALAYLFQVVKALQRFLLAVINQRIHSVRVRQLWLRLGFHQGTTLRTVRL